MRKYLPYASLALFGVAMAAAVSAVLTWRLSSLPPRLAEGAASPFSFSPRSRSLPADRNIFGARLEEDAAPQAPPAPPPGKLMVVGVMSAGRPNSHAIIRDVSADSTVVYTRGQWVFGRTEYLAAVDAYGVVLAGPYGRRRLEVGVAPDQQAPIVTVPTAPAAATAPGIDISRAEVNASVQSAEQLLGESKIFPEIRNGRIVGFRVSQIADNSIIKKMGIQANDIIKNVNGQGLDSLERSAEIWQKMKTASEIHMLVERNGADQTMSYYMRP
jgi:general secretion pathway protein C